MSFLNGLNPVQKWQSAAFGVAAIAMLGLVGNRYIDSTKDQARPRAGLAQVTQQSNTDGRANYPVTSSSSKAKFRPALGSININSASQQELEQLPGVGPATAIKIIEHRQRSGGFRSIDELDLVKGIGPKKLAEMRPYCRL